MKFKTIPAFMDFYNIGTSIYCRLHDDIYDECVACAQTDVVDRRHTVYSYGSLRDLLESEKFEFDYVLNSINRINFVKDRL